MSNVRLHWRLSIGVERLSIHWRLSISAVRRLVVSASARALPAHRGLPAERLRHVGSTRNILHGAKYGHIAQAMIAVVPTFSADRRTHTFNIACWATWQSLVCVHRAVCVLVCAVRIRY